MQIQSAKFITSSTNLEQMPDNGLAEYAFIGRSNVGKSSLINLLTNKKSLTKTSSAPGKTRTVNHFLINDKWYLVDLPGYGYAKTGKKERASMLTMVNSYLRYRKPLVNVFLLVDSRHSPQKSDLEYISRMGEHAVPFAIIFTKIDKLNEKQFKKNIAHYRQTLEKDWDVLPPVFFTSALSKTGSEDILEYIEQVNKAMEDNMTPAN